jgi:hypothetical protein
MAPRREAAERNGMLTATARPARRNANFDVLLCVVAPSSHRSQPHPPQHLFSSTNKPPRTNNRFGAQSPKKSVPMSMPLMREPTNAQFKTCSCLAFDSPRSSAPASAQDHFFAFSHSCQCSAHVDRVLQK